MNKTGLKDIIYLVGNQSFVLFDFLPSYFFFNFKIFILKFYLCRSYSTIIASPTSNHTIRFNMS